MSEKMQCNMYISNTTGGMLTFTNSNLPWGKWRSSPPTQIPSGKTEWLSAIGAKGSATGTSGSVTYMFADNITTFTINFDIPYSGANSGTMTLNGSGASNYTANETDSSFAIVTSFPTSGSDVTVWYAIGAASTSVEKKKSSITRAVAAKIAALTSETPNPMIDIVGVARAADCGEISGPELLAMFKGRTSATYKDILGAENLNLSATDRVGFVSNRGLISSKSEFKAAIDFAAHVIEVLQAGPTKGMLYELAAVTITVLRDMLNDAPQSDLEKLANEIEDAKALMLAQRDLTPLLPKIAALDGILACIYMSPGAALAQAGGCARDTGTNAIQSERIAEWQLTYLKDMPD